MAILRIGLNSGREIIIDDIMLYPAANIASAMAMKTEAMQKMGGASTGLGFWGSPGWAIGGALVLGAIEAAASKSMQKDAIGLIARAEQELSAARAAGTFVAVSDVANLGRPDPQGWTASLRNVRTIALTGLSDFDVSELCARHNIPSDEVYSKSFFGGFTLKRDTITATEDRPYMFDGDPFVCVRSADQVEHVRWSDVSSYKHEGTARAG